MTRRIAVTVRGIVQGVGFRPCLHRLAAQYGLAGWVRNTAFGVELELEGEPRRLDAFLHTLRTAPPPLAVLEQVESRALPGLAGYRGFTIRPSLPGSHATLVSPDIATCPDCLRELRTPTDRRYRYPFINCTNCGPRFTITKTVPYDRANTTMAPFQLCEPCAAEYADIENRRYHAQPTCCPACGPHLELLDAAGNPLPGDPLAQAQKLLGQGKILAVKGLGGFHLACLAEAGPAETLRARKHRDEKPFALMCADLAAARQLCRVSEAAANLLESPRRPIVLCPKKEQGGLDFLSDTNTLGILLPYTPLHYLLFEPAESGPAEGADQPEKARPPRFSALIMTSANLSDTPVVTQNRAALAELAGIADGFLVHDRAIDARCDDSLLAMGPGEAPIFYRRSRGWVPQPIFTDFDAEGILALGAEQKAGFALGRGRVVFCPPHIGDLKNAETLAHYTGQAARFETLFGVKPRLLVCDAHPDYLSTDYARRRAEAESLPLLRVQHHHAHMASCMADNRLPGDARVIGVVWDGTGLGTDGTVWGGEFLVGGYRRADRAAALRPIALPGGDAAIKAIGRIGFSLARDAGCDLAAVSALPPGEQALLNTLLAKKINCPESSGMGRLFDGVYALLTGRGTVNYEGQGAVLLQALAERHLETPVPVWALPLLPDPTEATLRRADTRPLVRGLVAGRAAGLPPETLAMAFHRALAELAAGVCAGLRGADPTLTAVVLSGGVFQNTLLLGLVKTRLEGAGFTVYTHHRVAPNDEGIALGQLAVAAHTGE